MDGRSGVTSGVTREWSWHGAGHSQRSYEPMRREPRREVVDGPVPAGCWDPGARSREVTLKTFDSHGIYLDERACGRPPVQPLPASS